MSNQAEPESGKASKAAFLAMYEAHNKPLTPEQRAAYQANQDPERIKQRAAEKTAIMASHEADAKADAKAKAQEVRRKFEEEFKEVGHLVPQVLNRQFNRLVDVLDAGRSGDALLLEQTADGIKPIHLDYAGNNPTHIGNALLSEHGRKIQEHLRVETGKIQNTSVRRPPAGGKPKLMDMEVMLDAAPRIISDTRDGQEKIWVLMPELDLRNRDNDIAYRDQDAKNKISQEDYAKAHPLSDPLTPTDIGHHHAYRVAEAMKALDIAVGEGHYSLSFHKEGSKPHKVVAAFTVNTRDVKRDDLKPETTVTLSDKPQQLQAQKEPSMRSRQPEDIALLAEVKALLPEGSQMIAALPHALDPDHAVVNITVTDPKLNGRVRTALADLKPAEHEKKMLAGSVKEFSVSKPLKDISHAETIASLENHPELAATVSAAYHAQANGMANGTGVEVMSAAR